MIRTTYHELGTFRSTKSQFGAVSAAIHYNIGVVYPEKAGPKGTNKVHEQITHSPYFSGAFSSAPTLTT